METNNFIILMTFVLFFFIITTILLNWLLLYRGFKRKEMGNEEINTLLPTLIAGNLSLFISLFIIFKSLINYITYNIGESTTLLNIFSVSSIVLIINSFTLFVSYFLTQFVVNVFIKIDSLLFKAILWVLVNSILIFILNELYVQISSSNTFTIY